MLQVQCISLKAEKLQTPLSIVMTMSKKKVKFKHTDAYIMLSPSLRWAEFQLTPYFYGGLFLKLHKCTPVSLGTKIKILNHRIHCKTTLERGVSKYEIYNHNSCLIL